VQGAGDIEMKVINDASTPRAPGREDRPRHRQPYPKGFVRLRNTEAGMRCFGGSGGWLPFVVCTQLSGLNISTTLPKP
jgi:hypothetical protein